MKFSRRLLPSVLICFLMFSNIFAQSRVNDWKHYTSIINFTEIISSNDKVYCSSSGGIVEFDPIDNSFFTYSTECGMSRVNLETIAKDINGNLWTGSGDPIGEINIFDPIGKDVIKVFDHSTWNENFTSITNFASTENKMFVVCQLNTDWGILEFQINNQYSYKDFYFNFPVDFEKINSINIIEDNLYISTSAQLLSANYKTSDLKNPDSWKIIYSSDLITNTILFDNEIYFGASRDIFVYNGNDVSNFINNVNGEINHLESYDENLFVSTNKVLISIDKEKNTNIIFDNGIRQALQINDIIVGSSSNSGLLVKNGDEINQYIPNTLLGNANTAVCIDNKNRIIAGSSLGFSICHEKGWKNIVRTNGYEKINENEYDWNYFIGDSIPFSSFARIYSLVERNDGYIFATIYGCSINESRRGALIKFNPEDLSSYELFDTIDGNLASSSGYPGGNDSWLGIGRMKFDKNDNLWICNQYADNGNVIAVLKNDDTWTHFSINESHSYLTKLPTTIAFDKQNRIWIGSESGNESDGKITILDYNNTLDDKSDDKWYQISTNQQLASNDIFDLEFDKNGTLFIMTSGGIQEAEIYDTFSNNNYFVSIDENAKFSNLSFAKENVIKIDEQNNKWITTSDAGVLVYSWNNEWRKNSLGEIIPYNIDNSDLISNNVLDIDFIDSEGQVVMSTTKGISILKSQYSVDRKEYPKLKIFPMPFKIPSEKSLVIEGLLPESEVKIITLDGTFIRKLTTKQGNVIGTQAFWDGKNANGKLVSSGIYICMAFTDDQKNIAGKIAVIRY